MTEQLDARAGYIKGLRALADVLEKHGEVPLPYHGTGTEITINNFLNSDDPRAELAAAARALPCNWDKGVRGDDKYGYYFNLTGKLHGLGLMLTAFRDAVCERVVTGTTTVTEKVKDPEALAAVPEIEVTREVEEVRWECHPVLAPAAQPENMVTA